jgi:predicted DCC family thiol-disulfide oxidoreductase YuxK
MEGGARGWVLYDDGCGFCREWIPFRASTLRKRGFGIAPLQSAWVRKALRESEPELLSDLRLLLSDGGQVRGADVYRYLMARIAWAYPLYLLPVVPGLRQVFDWTYRTFNRHRYRFSSTCGLPGRNSGSEQGAAQPALAGDEGRAILSAEGEL